MKNFVKGRQKRILKMDNAYYIEPKPLTLLEKVSKFLFPVRYAKHKATIWKTRDSLNMETNIKLSITDRFRLIISGKLLVHSITETENVIGECDTDFAVYVKPPFSR